MLRRQNSGLRARKKKSSMRELVIASLLLIFAFCMYFNYRFFSSNGGIHGRKDVKNSKYSSTKFDLSAQLNYETKKVKRIIFTSGCSEVESIHTEILVQSIRDVGYSYDISHLIYGCQQTDYASMAAKKNPTNNVTVNLYPHLTDVSTLFGTGLLTTTINPKAIKEWVDTSGEARQLGADDFIMITEYDAIFTKNIDLWNLFREVDGIQDPKWFGQDAAWYTPGSPILPKEELDKVIPHASRAKTVEDWREYAATGPYVLEMDVLRTVLSSANEYWSKLDSEHKHLAFSLAAAHHGIPMGISGVLSVHHYPSRYENWDFADDVKHNPCNESIENDINLASFPITLRPVNLTLPTWIDGRTWSFSNRELPRDLLNCDAWMFKEPTGYLWYLASHTNGYERVPTILRRRHTISICLTVKTYNLALSNYKAHFCSKGFNNNKRITFDTKYNTALAFGKNTTVVHQFHGDYPALEQTKRDIPDGSLDSNSIHFVFSSTCSPYQNWQSQVLISSFTRVGQRGKLTRIVSGCDDEEMKEVLAWGKSNPNVYLHFTKDFRDRPLESMQPDNYPPYNKAFGLRDWIQNSNPPVKENIVVLLDPDFIFLKPFAVNSNWRITKHAQVDSRNKDHMEVIEGFRQYKRFYIYEGKRAITEVSDKVVEGTAIAQRWSAYLGAAGFDVPNGDNKIICPECDVKPEDAIEYYSVGPPYALTRNDLSKIVDDYCHMTVKKRQRHKDFWMVEMLGYILATSKHKIKHSIFDNLAVAGKEDDYLDFTEALKENPCADPIAIIVNPEAPTFFHGCHRYKAVDSKGFQWIYYKQEMPEDLFSCDAWMLETPDASVWEIAKASDDKKMRMHAYGLCTSIKLVNAALLEYKHKHCPNGFNQNRKLRLINPRPRAKLKVGQFHSEWENTDVSLINQ